MKNTCGERGEGGGGVSALIFAYVAIFYDTLKVVMFSLQVWL